MHVDPFWFGVLTTIVVELIACIVYAAISENKRGGK